MSCLIAKESPVKASAGNDGITVVLEEGSYGNHARFGLNRESLEAVGPFRSYWNSPDKVIRI